MNSDNEELIIDKLNEIINLIKNTSFTEKSIISEKFVAPIIVPEKPKQTEFEYLRKLLHSEEWPAAVSSFLICGEDDEEKIERAENVLDLISFDLQNKKLLDFGCGEGHVALKSVQELTNKSIGYDIIKTGNLNWEEENQNCLLTINFDKVTQYAPYDYIILYDVLDHSREPLKILEAVKSLSNSNTKIFVRCHPWTGRHAIHQYKVLNKAFVHLVFDELELEQLNINFDHGFIKKDFYPIKNNNELFEKLGLKVNSHDTISNKVEEFFKKNDVISKRIKKHYDSDEFPDWQLSQIFNDYVLTIDN